MCYVYTDASLDSLLDDLIHGVVDLACAPANSVHERPCANHLQPTANFAGSRPRVAQRFKRENLCPFLALGRNVAPELRAQLDRKCKVVGKYLTPRGMGSATICSDSARWQGATYHISLFQISLEETLFVQDGHVRKCCPCIIHALGKLTNNLLPKADWDRHDFVASSPGSCLRGDVAHDIRET